MGDRLFLTIIVSFFDGDLHLDDRLSRSVVYSATHQYSWGDYGLTFVGLMGLATPNFLLALVLLYIANVAFGTSIGGLDGFAKYIDQPWTWDKVDLRPRAPVDSGHRHRHLGNRRHDPTPARQPSGRARETVRGHRPRQGR